MTIRDGTRDWVSWWSLNKGVFLKKFGHAVLIMMAFIPTSAACQLCVEQISVPKYPPIALAARVTGIVELTVSLGARGEVVRVEGKGSPPMLVDPAQENVKQWVFCSPKKNGSQVRLQYDYRLQGTPVYPPPRTSKVQIDLGEARVLITMPPPKIEP